MTDDKAEATSTHTANDAGNTDDMPRTNDTASTDESAAIDDRSGAGDDQLAGSHDSADNSAGADENSATPYRLVVVSGGTSDPSSTLLLGNRIADRVATQAGSRGERVLISTIDLRTLATEITTAMVSQLLGPGITQAIERLAAADGVVASTPVYKAAPSGLFSSFFHILDNDLLIGKPIVLAATAGTARHALVIDNHMRALFAFLRALPAPTSVFAATEDWNSGNLGSRIDRAAFELLLLMESGFASKIREGSWGQYQHEYGSAGSVGSAGADGTEFDIDLSSDLMRLATGGTA